jgi:radical SAM superfamily enzyme YgiQ (UPF0313 family)
MKITLVEPKAPGLHIWSKFRLPRLGPLLLGTILAREGHEVEVYFEEAVDLDWERLRSSDLVGISSITSTAPRAYDIADRVRAGGVPVVLGGPHPTFLPEEALNHADYVFRGEADLTVAPFVEALETGGALDAIPGISFLRDGEIVHNPDAPLVQDLDALPFPDLDLAAGEVGANFSSNRIIPMQTSRGCPYDCAFCSVTGMFGRKYRFRSTASVMAELRRHDLAGNHVFFYDDNFTASPRRTKELLRAMIKAHITPSWSTQVHTDCARDEELLELMQRSGCDTLYIGLESINPATLEAYNKKQTPEGMARALQRIHAHDIDVHGMFVFGGEYDTAETLLQTAEWAKAQNIATVQFLILTPFPGTRTYDELEAQGRILLRDWSLYDAMHLVFRPRLMSPEELQVETYRAQGRFYSWGQVLRRLADGDLINAVIRAYAGSHNRRWLKKNRDFVRMTRYLGATK